MDDDALRGAAFVAVVGMCITFALRAFLPTPWGVVASYVVLGFVVYLFNRR